MAHAKAHPPLSEREALVESQACLQCGGPYAPAPCVTGCPAGIDIPGFIRDVAQGRPVDAARKIFTENILGGSCARVCPVEVLCQGRCVLQREGRRPIQIGRLQRFATDRAFEEGEAPTPGPSRCKREQSVGVIGAGPSGLACSAELARMGYAVTVYERRRLPGGLITHGIAPYKQQTDPLPQEVESIRRLGVRFRFGVSVGRDVTVEQLRRTHQAVFLGVGMGADLMTGIPGEELSGVWESLRFIEALKLGQSDELDPGPRVAVIGGGNTAIDVAREAVLLGAADVQVLYRRTEAQMPAYAHEIAAAKREGVKIVPLVAPLEFLGWERVRGVRCIRMELGPPDASGRPRPVPIEGSEFVHEADTVIVAIGQAPHDDLVKHVGVGLRHGAISVSDDMQTDIPWCFAGGDCTNGGATVVEGVRDGKRAARAIDRFLSGQSAPPAVAPPPGRVEEDDGTHRHYQGEYRLTTAPALCKGCSVCVTGCPSGTLTLNGAGRISVKDINTCVFCGLCEARCPDFAIWVVKERAAPAAAGCEAGA